MDFVVFRSTSINTKNDVSYVQNPKESWKPGWTLWNRTNVPNQLTGTASWLLPPGFGPHILYLFYSNLLALLSVAGPSQVISHDIFQSCQVTARKDSTRKPTSPRMSGPMSSLGSEVI